MLKKRKGIALIMSLAILDAVLVSGVAYINISTQGVRMARHREVDTTLLNLCDAAIQRKALEIWLPFKTYQRFDDSTYNMDNLMTGASTDNPRLSTTYTMNGVGSYTAGVINYTSPDTYTRYVTIRGVGWVDRNNNGALDTNEPRKVVDVTTRYSLNRSSVFDYAYFINNYGWFYGFTATSLQIAGDIRANGNMEFQGTGTVNGSIWASYNSKLVPPAAGTVNATPTQWTNSTYETKATAQMRQAYNSSKHGAIGSSDFEQWRDLIYNKDASVVGDRFQGSVIGDNRGVRTFGGTILDPQPTQEVPMPDLSNLATYTAMSNNYVNPSDGQGAYIEYYDFSTTPTPTLRRIDKTYNGSIGLIGTPDYPIKIHGPVTVTEDVVIKGTVTGQGTIYTGRNTHIIGTLSYKNPPDFRGTDPSAIDAANATKDFLGLASRGSVILGNVKNFTSGTPLQYFKPPFTKPRYDDFGNYIPAYDGTAADGTDVSGVAIKKYQSRLGNTYINTNSTAITQIDAVIYTNNLCGGTCGTSGTVTFNGSIIAKDEGIVPGGGIKFNYDNRLKERSLNQRPLIDINLPRSPSLMRSGWQYQTSAYY